MSRAEQVTRRRPWDPNGGVILREQVDQNGPREYHKIAQANLIMTNSDHETRSPLMGGLISPTYLSIVFAISRKGSFRSS